MLRIPNYLPCRKCGGEILTELYLEHLELHGIRLNRKACVHVPIYNDVLAFKRTGDNVRDHGLFCIVNDGRFPGFKKINDSDNSTDGTKELVLSYDNAIYFQHGEDFEESKFNFASHLAAKMGFKYFILLGSDEWMIGNLDKFLQDLDKRMEELDPNREYSFQIAIDEHQSQNKWNRFITESPKVYANIGLLRTRFSHWLRYSTSQMIEQNEERPLNKHEKRICSMVIHHDDSIRGKSRNDLMTSFQDKNVKREKQRIQREVIRKIINVSILTSPRKLAEWHKSFFLKNTSGYTHYLIYDDNVKLTAKFIEKFSQTLISLRESDLEFDGISAVVNVGSNKSWRVSHVPPNKKFLTQKIFEIYNKSNYEKKNRYFALYLDLGPIVLLSKKTVETIQNITDKEAFLEECQEKGIRIFCDSSIQLKDSDFLG